MPAATAREYSGSRRFGTNVWVTTRSEFGNILSHHELDLREPRHSPTGFEWGYSGSGPAELARQILWDHFGEEPHPVCYQQFKEHFIAPLPRDEHSSWTITDAEINVWLAAYEGEWKTIAEYERYLAGDDEQEANG